MNRTEATSTQFYQYIFQGRHRPPAGRGSSRCPWGGRRTHRLSACLLPSSTPTADATILPAIRDVSIHLSSGGDFDGGDRAAGRDSSIGDRAIHRDYVISGGLKVREKMDEYTRVVVDYLFYHCIHIYFSPPRFLLISSPHHTPSPFLPSVHPTYPP